MSISDVIGAIWAVSSISAMFLTVILCVLVEFAQKRYLVEQEDAYLFGCFIFWVAGPIAVICYVVAIFYLCKMLITDKSEYKTKLPRGHNGKDR